MAVVFTTTYAFRPYHHYSYEFESHSWPGVLDETYMIKFVSDLRQVGGYLQVPSSIKLTAMI